MMASRFSNDEIAFQALAESGPDPSVAKLWDFEQCEMRVEAFETYLRSASHGEIVFAKFLAMVWFGRDKYRSFPEVDGWLMVARSGAWGGLLVTGASAVCR